MQYLTSMTLNCAKGALWIDTIAPSQIQNPSTIHALSIRSATAPTAPFFGAVGRFQEHTPNYANRATFWRGSA